MIKTDSGNWEAEGSLEGNPFVAKTIKYGKELIFKVVEGSDVAKSLTESDFSRGDRVSIAAACKSVRIALEISGQDQLEAPMKPGKRQASATSGACRAAVCGLRMQAQSATQDPPRFRDVQQQLTGVLTRAERHAMMIGSRRARAANARC
jgi:hypothetical protein